MSTRQKSTATKSQVSKKQTAVSAPESVPAPVTVSVVAAPPVVPPAVSAPVPAPAPAPEPAAKPAMPKISVSLKPTTNTSNAAEQPSSTEETLGDEKPKRVRARPRNRTFNELYSEMLVDIQQAYKSLQAVSRNFRSLASAHQREVSTKLHRDVTVRTPTTLFDQPLVDYFLSKLSREDLQITRKNGDSVVNVDLSELSTETPVFRTDLTKLYSAVFRKHGLSDSDDHRNINYTRDPELVALLTSDGIEAKYSEEVKQIREGTLKLTIFNIQRFLNQHLRTLERDDATSAAPETADALAVEA